MRIHVDLDDSYDEVEVTIHAPAWTEELDQWMNHLNQPSPKRLVGIQSEQSILLSPEDVDCFFAQQRKVYALRNQEAIEIHRKLYELEELLEHRGFIRLSKSALGNLHRMTRFDVGFNGNMCVYFRSGSKEYVSRRYVPVLKNKLLIGGE